VFFIDTPLRRIDRLVVQDGSIVSREAWADLAESPGVPDGMTIDDDGCLWVAMFDGGCLLRVSPTGRVDQQIDLPVSWPTSVAFAGPDSDTLLVTTGRSERDDPASPGGSILALDAGVTGAPTYPFALPVGPTP
jgi:sugar lactone lactonase YvrE